MKVSKLIKRLKKLKKKHGDLPVLHSGSGGFDHSDTDLVKAYGEGGVKPSNDEPAVEIYIH